MFATIKSKISKPLIGYIVLALAIVWALGSVRSEGIHRREDLRDSAKTVIVQSCQRDNQTRKILRGLIASGIPQTKKLVKEGTLTKAQGARQIRLSNHAIKKLPPLDCKKLGERFQAKASKA